MAKFSKKPGSHQLREKSLIDAAEAVFLEKGYEDATFTDLAVKSNYNKRTIYLYFESKDDIFAAVTYRLLDKIEEAVVNAIDKNKSGLENIENIAWAYYRFFEAHPKYFGLLWILEHRFFVPAKEKEYSPNILRSFEKRKIVINMISQIFEKGIVDGSIKISEDPKIVLPVLWSQTLGVLQVISRTSEYLASELQIQHKALFELHMKLVRKVLSGQ